MHVHRQTAASALTNRWVQTLDEVLRFKATHGKLPGDGGLDDRERSLQQWLKRQKAREDLGHLSPAQVQALDAVDGDWLANQSRLSWESNLTEAILEY